MKLKELILLEQSIADGKTAQEYKDAGYSRIAKGLINDKKKTGDVKTDVDGKSWYKATAATAATSTSTTNTNTITPVKKADESKFACIRNSNTKGKNLQQTKDNSEAYSFFNTDGSEFTFWVNGDFTYYDGDTTANGKWKCNGGNNFEANVDWKGTTHYFKSETNEWALTQNAKKTVYENTIKKIVSKNLKSLIK